MDRRIDRQANGAACSLYSAVCVMHWASQEGPSLSSSPCVCLCVSTPHLPHIACRASCCKFSTLSSRQGFSNGHNKQKKRRSFVRFRRLKELEKRFSLFQSMPLYQCEPIPSQTLTSTLKRWRTLQFLDVKVAQKEKVWHSCTYRISVLPDRSRASYRPD